MKRLWWQQQQTTLRIPLLLLRNLSFPSKMFSWPKTPRNHHRQMKLSVLLRKKAWESLCPEETSEMLLADQTDNDESIFFLEPAIHDDQLTTSRP
jgi:hypothetical protein